MKSALRVLVVEDSSAMRAFVRAALEDEGAEVLEAANGFEALRILPRDDFSLVIVDVNMPDINGLELISFMRNSERHRGTPLLIISTEAARADREKGISLGANGFLAKPFSVETLKQTVGEVTGER